jgi:hypothetical protein
LEQNRFGVTENKSSKFCTHILGSFGAITEGDIQSERYIKAGKIM